MSELLKRLGTMAQRGSKPRCHWLTHGTAEEVAARLTALAAPWATISSTDSWMPQGFVNLNEAQLHQAPRLLSEARCRALGDWWLPAGRQDARTPNFDIASSCTIEGMPGLLLIEAKAHDEELQKEATGRQLGDNASDDRNASHQTIGIAIDTVRESLSKALARPCALSRDSHYQMSNRFAWSWKLTELGIPVVLIYLGFLNADEMVDRGNPFGAHQAWDRLVREHSKALAVDEAWGKRWSITGVPFIPLIKSVEQPLAGAEG